MRGVAVYATREGGRDIASALQPLGGAIKLAAGQGTRVRADERPPTDGEGDANCYQHEQCDESNQQAFSKSRQNCSSEVECAKDLGLFEGQSSSKLANDGTGTKIRLVMAQQYTATRALRR